jgi:AraC-like DNA-binding protein
MGFASIGLFGAARLARDWKAAPDHKRTLSCFLVLLSLNVLHPVMSPLHFQFPGIFEPLEYLVPPLAWLMARHLVAPTRWAGIDAMHLLPAVLVLFWGYVNPWGPLGLLLAWMLLVAQAISYGLPTLRTLHRYRRRLLDNVSNLEGIDPRWLSSFLLTVMALVAIYAATMLFLLGSPRQTAFRPFLSLALGLATSFMTWVALDQRYLPPQALAPTAPARELSPEAKRLLDLLPEFMGRRRPYLDPDLSLGDLAEAMDSSRNALSLAINVGLDRTFYDFINEFRVGEVMRLMADPGRKSHKILALALDAGFNSKTSFNELFKKATGLTPSAYRRSLAGAGP